MTKPPFYQIVKIKRCGNCRSRNLTYKKAKLITTIRHAFGMCHYSTHIIVSGFCFPCEGHLYPEVLVIYLAKLLPISHG